MAALRGWLGFVVFAAVLAGCLGGGKVAPAPPTSGLTLADYDPTLAQTVVHTWNKTMLVNESFPGPLPAFEEHYVGSIRGVEPTIGVVPSGAAFYVGIHPHVGDGPQVYRSRDVGKTWEKVTPTAAGAIDYPPMTNDPFLYADPLTGRVFTVDLSLTGDCTTIQWTDDEGESWTSAMIDACGTSGSHDHQSAATGKPHGAAPAGYANIVYYCVNRGEALCFTSLDGGRTFGEPVATGLSFCGGLTGHVVTGPNGDAFLPQVNCQRTEEDTGAWIAISRDDGGTWEAVNVNATYPVLRDHEASVAVDAAGNVYYLFLDAKTMPTLAISRDGGRSWSAPENVAIPGLTAAKYPSLTAGDEGRIAVFYVGTTAKGGFAARDPATATWNAYVGLSVNALDAEPVFATSAVNPLANPLRRGPCTGRCQPGSLSSLTFDGMYDFMDITMDPKTGRIWTALVDLCHEGCREAGAADGVTIPGRAAAGVQVSGVTLKGAAL